MTNNKKLSASLEDYLEAIYHIVDKKQAAKARDIAQRLNVNSSSVTGALQNLAKKGLVNYAPYDIITLTSEGKRIAQDVIHRHTSLQKFLVKILSVDETEAEEAACKMEHVVSPGIMERLVQFVKFIDRCPLGGVMWDEERGFICKHIDTLESREMC